MLGLSARLPDPLVGLAPHGGGALALVDQHRPQALGYVVALLGVQVDRVQHGAEHVVLALVVGAVADAHGRRALIAAEVIERRLGEVFLAADAVHDLQRAVLVARDFGDVLDEVVCLPIQAERMQRPQRERCVAHPAVAVVPVALAARRLGQRGRRRRDQGAGRHEGQPLQHERRALQMRPPGVVGIGAFGQPAAPEVAGALEDLLGFLGGVRPAQRLGPGDRAEAFLALDHRVAAMRAVALDAHADVAEEPEPRLAVGRVHRQRVVRVRRMLGVAFEIDPLPLRGRRAVVEHRLAHDLHLHLALDAFDHAHEQVIGVEVGRRARVAGAVLVVVPFAHRQRVDHADPALRGHPRRLDHVRARHVAPPGGDVQAVGPDAPAAGAAVEQRAEHRRRVEVRHAHPLDRAVGGDERAGVAVRQEAVVGDRRERRALPKPLGPACRDELRRRDPAGAWRLARAFAGGGDARSHRARTVAG